MIPPHPVLSSWAHESSKFIRSWPSTRDLAGTVWWQWIVFCKISQWCYGSSPTPIPIPQPLPSQVPWGAPEILQKTSRYKDIVHFQGSFCRLQGSRSLFWAHISIYLDSCTTCCCFSHLLIPIPLQPNKGNLYSATFKENPPSSPLLSPFNIWCGSKALTDAYMSWPTSFWSFFWECTLKGKERWLGCLRIKLKNMAERGKYGLLL